MPAFRRRVIDLLLSAEVRRSRLVALGWTKTTEDADDDDVHAVLFVTGGNVIFAWWLNSSGETLRGGIDKRSSIAAHVGLDGDEEDDPGIEILAAMLIIIDRDFADLCMHSSSFSMFKETSFVSTEGDEDETRWFVS